MTSLTMKEIKTTNLRTTKNLAEFFEIAITCPHDIIVLQEQVPPSKEEVRRYCLVLNGSRKTSAFGEVWSVKYDPLVTNSTALSLQDLRPHTDGSFMENPPSRFVLSFTRSDPGGGGVSTFVSLTDILAASPDWALKAFYTANYLFVRTYDGNLTDSVVAPILNTDYNGNPRIRWRADEMFQPTVVNNKGTKAEEAVRWLQDFLQNHEPMTYAAKTGETLLVPNYTILHGRTALSSNSSREVLRAWIGA